MTSRFLIGLFFMAFSAASFAQSSIPPLPAPPNVPEAGYPSCLDTVQERGSSTAQLAALRRCRDVIEHFQGTYFEQFLRRIERYQANLQAYRGSLTNAGLSAANLRAATAAVNQAAEQLQAGGDLVEAKHRLRDRITRDLTFIGAEICRLRRRPEPRCT